MNNLYFPPVWAAGNKADSISVVRLLPSGGEEIIPQTAITMAYVEGTYPYVKDLHSEVNVAEGKRKPFGFGIDGLLRSERRCLALGN